MRPLRPACGTVSKAQLLTLPATISTSAPGVVTTQLSFLPPASSSATEVLGSSESRPATVLPPEPPPTTTKSNVSVTCVSPSLCFLFFISEMARRARSRSILVGGSAFVRFLARPVPRRHFQRKSAFSPPQKAQNRTLWAFPKQACVDTYASHPLATPGLPSQEAFGTVRRRLCVGRFVSGPALEGA